MSGGRGGTRTAVWLAVVGALAAAAWVGVAPALAAGKRPAISPAPGTPDVSPETHGPKG